MKRIRDRKLVHETMLVLTIAAALIHFLRHDHYSLWIVCGLGITGLFLPFLSEWITTLWMGLANLLGKISSTILLTVVFYLVLTPVALLRKFFRKENKSTLAEKNNSAFQERNHTFSPADLENPW